MPAPVYPITIEHGASFEVSMRPLLLPARTPLDLAGVRLEFTVAADFDAATPLIYLTSDAGGGIDVDVPTALIRIRITPDQAATLARDGTPVYTLKASRSAADVVRLLQGRVRVSPEA